MTEQTTEVSNWNLFVGMKTHIQELFENTDKPIISMLSACCTDEDDMSPNPVHEMYVHVGDKDNAHYSANLQVSLADDNTIEVNFFADDEDEGVHSDIKLDESEIKTVLNVIDKLVPAYRKYIKDHGFDFNWSITDKQSYL